MVDGSGIFDSQLAWHGGRVTSEPFVSIVRTDPYVVNVAGPASSSDWADPIQQMAV